MDQHLNRSQGGLGIGLTLVKRLLALHDGDVEVVSDGLGTGSEFRITLPIIPAAIAVTSQPEVPTAMALNGMNILVVDDNQDSADTLALLLEMSGAEVSVAYGGLPALEKIEKKPVHAAILDIGMADMDGIQLATRIRAQPRFSDTMLIALTGWGQAQEQRLTHAAGFDVHLVKPVEIDRLEALLSERLTRRA